MLATVAPEGGDRAGEGGILALAAEARGPGGDRDLQTMLDQRSLTRRLAGKPLMRKDSLRAGARNRSRSADSIAFPPVWLAPAW